MSESNVDFGSMTILDGLQARINELERSEAELESQVTMLREAVRLLQDHFESMLLNRRLTTDSKDRIARRIADAQRVLDATKPKEENHE